MKVFENTELVKVPVYQELFTKHRLYMKTKRTELAAKKIVTITKSVLNDRKKDQHEMDDHKKGKQEKNILWENKNQGPEGDNETRKEKGLYESHQENEFQRNRNWELSEDE
jgi:hypothetical protein